ncbi:MAG: glycogen synthase [Dehalococcoidia bacterium]|nr:glycogen synthase [Dehalococcoidia bacterium]
MEILFAAAEVSPFFKAGGLADVAGSLPLAMARLGHTVRLVAPLNLAEPPPGASLLPNRLDITVAGRHEAASLWQLPLEERATLYLIDCPHYFRRGHVYDEDDLERFTRFSLALAQLPYLPGWKPDVFHANDWHVCLAVREVSNAGGPPVLLTVHNVQYQGHFSPEWFEFTVGTFPEAEIFHQNRVYPNMLGLGLIKAQTVSTVSPTFAREIVTPEFAHGEETLFAHRQRPVVGILNGLDYDDFNPAADPMLAVLFDSSSLEERAVNKSVLQARVGLPQGTGLPLLGMVTRLVEQKGLDILVPALERFLPGAEAQLIILGDGETRYKDELSCLAGIYGNKMGVVLGFDEGMARLIYGGCDVFIMPSRFEPGGLGQLISMRYGAIPLVRHTGGLADTVTDLTEDLSQGNGFVFRDYTPETLEAALDRAVSSFALREEWIRLQRRVMGLDFSWGASARDYEALYRIMVEGSRK